MKPLEVDHEKTTKIVSGLQELGDFAHEIAVDVVGLT